MKESILITDESYRQDIQRLWRAVKRLRNAEDQYTNLKFTLKTWMLTYNGKVVKQSIDSGINVTELFKRLPTPPTNGDIITAVEKAGGDVATDLPVLFTGMIEIEYDLVAA